MYSTKICQQAIDHFGVLAQKQKAVEELSELITELSRNLLGERNDDACIEELADVIIMCKQLRLIYGPGSVDAEKLAKLERLAGIIGNGRSAHD